MISDWFVSVPKKKWFVISVHVNKYHLHFRKCDLFIERFFVAYGKIWIYEEGAQKEMVDKYEISLVPAVIFHSTVSCQIIHKTFDCIWSVNSYVVALLWVSVMDWFGTAP